MKTIAIVGRPNVGKSTLFNRIVGKKLAITYDVAGTTRDWKDATTEILGVKFRMVDTAGLEKAETGSLQAEMMKQTESALGSADMIILTVDGVTGITEDDKFFANHLRKSGKKIILAVNKCEKKAAETGSFYKLGLGEPVAVSAEHNLGLIDLYERILSEAGVSILEANNRGKSSKATKMKDSEEKTELQIAIIGRPNAGKSTIINKILGSERVITSEVAGTTRDAIEINFEYQNRPLKLIDTAGMRRKALIKDQLETYSVKDSLEAIKYAQVVVLVVDAAETLASQDLRLAGHVVDEGRALILAINKWDLVKDKKAYAEELDYIIGKQLGDIHGVKVLKFSALHDKSLNTMLDTVLSVYETWNMRVPTGKLNQWIEFVLSHHPPPIAKGRRIKIRYITQTKTRPPSFMLSCSQPDGLPDSYVKYLVNDLRKNFALEGVPIRVTMPKKTNPYSKNKDQ